MKEPSSGAESKFEATFLDGLALANHPKVLDRNRRLSRRIFASVLYTGYWIAKFNLRRIKMTTMSKYLTRRILNKALGLLIVMAIILASVPQFASAATDATCQATYTVKSGDYLVKIAGEYEVTWLDIAEANDLKSPYVLIVGQKLCIPGKSTSGATGGTTGSSGTASFTAAKSQNSLTITTSKFPTKSFYYVKVDDPRDKGIEWNKVGILSTGQETSVKKTFSLPTEFRNAPSVLVCLKNIYTDAQICNNPSYNHGSTKSDSGSGSTASWKGTFTVDIVSKSIEIETSKFPTNSFFNVKVDNASTKALEWHKVGVLRIGKNDSVTQTFSLPEELENASRVTVCLKNAVNDTVSCHVAVR